MQGVKKSKCGMKGDAEGSVFFSCGCSVAISREELYRILIFPTNKLFSHAAALCTPERAKQQQLVTCYGSVDSLLYNS